MTEECSEHHRLDRIEEKIDKMSEALIAIARTDEKLTNIEKSIEDIDSAILSIDDRIRDVEFKSYHNESVISNIIKLVWILITAGVGNILYFVITK